VSEPPIQIRNARTTDAEAVASLANELAQSFAFSREKFDLSYQELLAERDACLLLAASGDRCLGYLTAFERWAAEQGCALVALATRRAAPFYRALGYEDSATYFRKVLE
jgi:ribosomal protein S18 acetylase RimI-like enzyme